MNFTIVVQVAGSPTNLTVVSSEFIHRRNYYEIEGAAWALASKVGSAEELCNELMKLCAEHIPAVTNIICTTAETKNGVETQE